ncbi:uncharacterized protein [Chelonus insularis]|uniref:uncharacterized protein n=1 Tax=Chelonus insularis TaxID=460826 RepID=UPI001588EE34|nr:uncharacterized protein LOC118064185 [Chelonus insularis]
MGRFIILLLLGLITLGYATKCPQQRVSPGREILCYTSSLNIKVLENSICRCTTLVHQGHDLQDLGKTGLEDLRKSLKQLNHALQFVISINDARGILKTSADSRQEAIARIIGITNQIDGVELNVTAGSKERLVHFIQGLKKEMVRKSREKRIIIALPTKAELLAKHYDIKELSKYVDLFSIPTHYLMDDKDNYHTFHPSRLMGLFDLLNTDSLVDLVHGLGAVKRKILVSLPASGYKFTLKIKDQNTPSSPAEDKMPIMLDRVQLCNEILQGEWTIERDEDLTAPYAFKNDSWIAFEDKISSKIKGKYILLRDLAGIGVRNIENDLPNDCGKTVTEDIYHSFTTNQRKSREAVLMSLEDDIYNSEVVYPSNLKSSDFKIARIVDTQGNIHAVRENTHTEFSCPKQGYYVHPKSCNRFYRCVKFNQQIEQYSIFEFDCPAGLAFDETTEVCVWPGSLPQGSACPGSPEIAPSGARRFHCPGEGYYADPQNCRWFFACMDLGAEKMMAYEFQCPYGLVFDEHKLACEWPWLVPKCAGTGYERKDYGNEGGQSGHKGQGGYDGHGGQGGYDGHGGQGGYGGHGGQGGTDGHGGQGGYDGHGGQGGYDGHGGQGGTDGHGGQGGYDGHGGQGGYDGHGGQGGYDGHGGQGGYEGHGGQGGTDGHGGQGGTDGHGGQGGTDGHGGQGGYDGYGGQGGTDSHGGQGGYDGHGGQGGTDSHGGQGGTDGHKGQEGYGGHGGQGGTDGHGGQGGYDGHGGQGGYDGHGGQGGYDGHGGQGGTDGHGGQGGYDGHGGQGGYDGHGGQGGTDGHGGQGGYDGHGGQGGYDGHGGQGGYDGHGGQGGTDGHGGQGGYDGHGGQGGYDGHGGQGGYDGHGGQGGYDGHGGQGGYDGHGGQGGTDGHGGQGGTDGHGGQGGYDGHGGQGGYDGHGGQGGYDGHGGQGGYEGHGGQGGTDGHGGQGGYDGHGGQGGYDGHGGQGGYDGHGGQGGTDSHGGQGGTDGHKGQEGYGGHGGQGGTDGHGGQGGYDGHGGQGGYDGHGGQGGYDGHGGQGGTDGHGGQGGYDGHGGQGGYDGHGGQGGTDGHGGQGGYDGHGGQGGYDGHGGQGGYDGHGGQGGTDGHGGQGGYDGHGGQGGYDGHGGQGGYDGHGGQGGYDGHGGQGGYDGHGGQGGTDGHGGQGGTDGHGGQGGYDGHGGQGGYDGHGGQDGNDGHGGHDNQGSHGYDSHDEHGNTDYDNEGHVNHDIDNGQGHPGDYDNHEGNQGEHDGYDNTKGGPDNQYDHNNEGAHEEKDEHHESHDDNGHDGYDEHQGGGSYGGYDESSKGGDKSYDGHSGGNDYEIKKTDHGHANGFNYNQGGYDEKGHGGYDYSSPDSKHYDGQGSDDNYDKKEHPTGYDKHKGGSAVTGHGVTVEVIRHGGYDGSQDKKHEEDHINKGYDGKDQGHGIEKGIKHPGYDYPISVDHETTLGHEEKNINIHGDFGAKTTRGFSQSYATSGGFTPSFKSTGQDTPSILHSGYTPSDGSSHTFGYTSKANSYTQHEGNHGHYPNTVTGSHVTPAVEIGGKPSLTTSHDSTIYRGDSGRFTGSSGTVLTSPHQGVGIISGVTQTELIHTHSGAANTAGYSINHGINTDYGKSTVPHFGVHGTTPTNVIPDVYIQGHTTTKIIPGSKITTGNEYYTNQAHKISTDGYTTKNKNGYSFGGSSAVPGTQFYTKQTPALYSQGFTKENKNEAGITLGDYSTPQDNKYYTNQASLSFTGSIKSNEQGFTPSMSVSVTGNQYHPNQAGESFTSNKIAKTPLIYTPISYTSSDKYPTNDIKTSTPTSGYQKTPSKLGTTSSINYSGSGNRYYTNQAGYNTNIGFSTSSGSLFTPKQSITSSGNQYHTNQAVIPTPSGPEEIPITSVNDGSGYRTNEYHDNGGRGTIRYNNGVVTHKYTEDDIRDHRAGFTDLPPTEVTEASTFTSLNSGGVYTKGGFTKTGPTKTGITTAQVGGSGSYVAGDISMRPTAKPDEIGENAFGTVSKGIFGKINSLSYSTPSSNIDGSYVIDNSKMTGTQSSVISSGYSYDIPENKLNIYSTDAPVPQTYTDSSPPYLDIKVYNMKETTTPSPSINIQSHSITSHNLDGLHATGFSRISGTQSPGHSYDNARNQFNTRPTVAPVSPQGHSSPYFDIQVYNRKGISTPSPTTTSPDTVNTHSYAKSTSSQYQETMYQSGKSSHAASTGEYFKPTPQRKYPTVSSTAQPVGYTTGPLNSYKTTLFNAAKIPVTVPIARPVFDANRKTVISTTEIPVPIEGANYDYKGNDFIGSIATKDESFLNVGVNFEQPSGPVGPSAAGKVTSSVNYQYSTQSQDVADKYTELEEVGSLGYSLGNVDGDFGYKINQESGKSSIDDHLTINIQPQGFKRPSTVSPLNKETYNRPIEIGGSYKDSSKSKESFDGYKYTKPTKEFNSGSVAAIKDSSTLSPSQSVTTSPNFNIGIYNNEVTKPEINYNRGNAKYTPSDEYDDTKFSSGLSKTTTYDYTTTSRFREHEGIEVNINNQEKSELTTPKSSISELSRFSPSIPSQRPSLGAQTRTSTYSPPVTTYSGNYKKSSTTPNYPVMTKSSQESISKGKGKVIVKLSDLHPVLLGKLSAECTCKADPFASFRGNKPLLIESDKGKVDLRNYDESDVYVDLENSKELNNYGEEVETAVYRSSTPSVLISTHENPVVKFNEAVKSRRPASTYLPVASTPRPPSSTYLPSTTASSLLRVSASDIEASSYSSRARSRSGKSLGSSRSNNLSKEKASDRTDFGEIGVLELNPEGRAECARPGLFRHPKHCNKFYACHWDDWKKKFTLHIFNCPIHLTFDSSAGACNWPSKGPACQDDNLLI